MSDQSTLRRDQYMPKALMRPVSSVSISVSVVKGLAVVSAEENFSLSQYLPRSIRRKGDFVPSFFSDSDMIEFTVAAGVAPSSERYS